MSNRIFPVGATFALLMGLMIGCTDSAVDSTSTSTMNEDAFEMYAVDEAAMADFSEVPTVDEVFATNAVPVDSAVENNRRAHIWGKVEVSSYKHILRQLNLTDEQKAAIKRCFEEYRECVRYAVERYRNARQEKHDGLKDRIARVRAAVEDGSMTPEQGRDLVKGFIEAYRNDVIELNAAFKAALKECKDRLRDCIRGHLTPEQIAKWDELNG